MNSELEKLIEKYRITVNGLADLKSGYTEVIKERGFVTLNGLLVEEGTVSGEPVADSSTEHTAAVDTVTAPSENADTHSTETVNTPNPESAEAHSPSAVAAVPSGEPAPTEPAPVVPPETPGVTPAPVDLAISDSTNLGAEESSEDSEDSTEELSPEGTPRKPKKKKN